MSQSRADFDRRSTILKDNFMAAESDFDAISHHELAQSIVDANHQKVPPIMGLAPSRSHEIACGGDAQMMTSRN